MKDKMQRIMGIMLVGLLAGLLLAACGGNSAEDVVWTTFESSDMGFSMEAPETWTRENNAELSIVSLKHPSEDVGVFVFAISRADLASFGAETPEDLLGVFIAQAMSDGVNVQIVQDAQPVTINGQEGATAVLEGELEGQQGLLTFTAVGGENNVIIMSTGDGTEGDFDALLQRMRDSIVVD